MANQRKSKSRKSWVAVAQRLSGEVRRKASPFRSGAGHKVAVESGKPRRLGRVGSVGENLLDFMLRAEKISGYDKEYQFHPTRKWRFDFAWPLEKFAVEIEGGVWSGGRHTRGKGFIEDCIKYNEAVMLGWRVIRVTTEMVKSGEAMAYIERKGD
jgi:very-short-patch-repair endonuclease